MHVDRIKTSQGTEEDESEIAKRVAEAESKSNKPRTQADLLVLARSYGIEAKNLGEILKAAGFTGYSPEQHDGMERAILDYVGIDPALGKLVDHVSNS